MNAVRYVVPFLMALLPLTFVSCSEDVQDTYSGYDAFLRFQPVTAVAPLYAALNSLGEYCTIRQNEKQYLFNGPGGSAVYTKVAADSYNPMRAIGGFIVGKSNLMDMGSNTFPHLCYDLACPNCYASYNVARVLKVEGGTARCERCKRTYDLNNQGIISEGDAGKKLIRYRIQYGGDLLYIKN